MREKLGTVIPGVKESAEATRVRLLQAATEVFAEQGFQAATVRDISARVGANVAAVNYHFGDKLGLYTEVLRLSLIAEEDGATHALVGAAATPEEALRVFIARMLAKTANRGETAFQFRIMAQEMARPTPALKQVVDEVIQPKFLVLRNILGKILGYPPDHDATRMCAHSLIGQVMHYANAQPVIAILWPDLDLVRQLDSIADHIHRFTLHGLQGMAKTKGLATRTNQEGTMPCLRKKPPKRKPRAISLP